MIEMEWCRPGVWTRRRATKFEPLRMVIQSVCDQYRVAYREMIGKRRHQPLARIRQEAYWRCRNEVPEASYPDIAKAFGDRDHTSIMYGIEKHEARMNEAQTKLQPITSLPPTYFDPIASV